MSVDDDFVYEDGTAVPGKTYRYWVTAVNEMGESAAGSAKSIVCPNAYAVRFVSNGASGAMIEPMTCEPNRVYLLPKVPFVNVGKRFVGWACSNGRRYDDGMLVFDLAKPGETVTMTAIWE